MPTGSYPLVVVLQVVIATAGQVADATAPESQRAARLMVMMRSRDEWSVPAERDRFEPGDGQFDGDRGQRQQDHGLQQLLAGCQEAGTFRTGIPGYGRVDAVIGPAQMHRERLDLLQVGVLAATVGPIFTAGNLTQLSRNK